MVKVTFDHGPKHLSVDPEFTGLFLRQGTGAVDASQHRARCTRIGARQVISLASTTVVKDLVAAMGVANRREALHDLASGCIPIDRFEGAVWFASQGRGNPVFSVLIAVQA